jgi:hypothetical protein
MNKNPVNRTDLRASAKIRHAIRVSLQGPFVGGLHEDRFGHIRYRFVDRPGSGSDRWHEPVG